MNQAMTALACFLCLLFGMTAAAQDDAVNADVAAADADDIDRDGRQCISVSRLKDTYVVDDNTVLFFMRGGDIYRNILSYECHGLKRENRFSYSVKFNRLCDTDWISVLQYFGRDLSEGISCGLGQFFAISEEEAEFLRYGERSEIHEEPEAD